MSAWVCPECTAAYSVGAPRCPQCGHTEHLEEGQDMPKITVHGGATDATFDTDEGGEQSSPTPEAAGSTSSTSSKKGETSPETGENAPDKRARTTGNRSSKGRTGSSSARGTAGGPTAPTSDDES